MQIKRIIGIQGVELLLSSFSINILILFQIIKITYILQNYFFLWIIKEYKKEKKEKKIYI